MNRFDKLLSYIYPISIETAGSLTNEFLEVIYQDGKYILNSTNTNYSYSGLYELFKLVFQNVIIDWDKVNNALILGFGAGCVVPLIQQYQPNCKIIGVEIDEKVVELGRKYFGVDNLKNTSIVIADAVDYLAKTDQKFDLVIIDVYVDRDVPLAIESPEFIANLRTSLNNNGIVIFNKLAYSRKVREQIPTLYEYYKRIFASIEVIELMETGRIFVGRR